MIEHDFDTTDLWTVIRPPVQTEPKFCVVLDGTRRLDLGVFDTAREADHRLLDLAVAEFCCEWSVERIWVTRRK